MTSPSIDIVIPIYNEEQSIRELYRELCEVINALPSNFAIIFVNDGSSDNSISELNIIQKSDKRVQIIDFVRNFGKEVALSAGLHNSTADAVITMDADLQHPPKYLPEFIRLWHEGAYVVVGKRAQAEQRSLFRRLSNKLFYFLINKASKVKISPDVMDFRIIDREVVEHFNRFTERNRITRGLIDWLGYPQSYIDLEIPERVHGTSTYSTRMLIKLAKDSLVSMSLLPLKISGYLGLTICSVFGVMGIIVLVDQAFLGDYLKISGAGSLGILTAFMIGVVLTNLGLVALYIANLHDEALGRPLYIAKKNASVRLPSSLNPREPIEFSSPIEMASTGHDRAVDTPHIAAPPFPPQIYKTDAFEQSISISHDTYSQVMGDIPLAHIEREENTGNTGYAESTKFTKNTDQTEHIDFADNTPDVHTPSSNPNPEQLSFTAPKPQTIRLNIPLQKSGPKHILWLSWKDNAHPLAGGAEVISTSIRERLARDGHTVTLLTSSFSNAIPEETINGVRIIRMGGRYTVHLMTMLHYLKHRKEIQADFAVDEVNTAPFFIGWYSRTPTVLFFHQLARQLWFMEIHKFFSIVGYIGEAVYLRLLSRNQVITVSRSSRLDLMRHGFRYSNISIISEGIGLEPVHDLSSIKKYEQPTVLSLGAVRSMKRTLEQVMAFEKAKAQVPNLKLIVAGDISGSYGQKVQDYISKSAYADDISVLGRVSQADKMTIMQRSHWLLTTSVKEGWCLVVTEAASQGTPAIVYNVDGLRDSVIDGITGRIVEPNVDAMAKAISEAFTRTDPSNTDSVDPSYSHMQKNAWEFSRTITFDRVYEDFKTSLNL